MIKLRDLIVYLESILKTEARLKTYLNRENAFQYPYQNCDYLIQDLYTALNNNPNLSQHFQEDWHDELKPESIVTYYTNYNSTSAPNKKILELLDDIQNKIKHYSETVFFNNTEKQNLEKMQSCLALLYRQLNTSKIIIQNLDKKDQLKSLNRWKVKLSPSSLNDFINVLQNITVSSINAIPSFSQVSNQLSPALSYFFTLATEIHYPDLRTNIYMSFFNQVIKGISNFDNQYSFEANSAKEKLQFLMDDTREQLSHCRSPDEIIGKMGILTHSARILYELSSIITNYSMPLLKLNIATELKKLTAESRIHQSQNIMRFILAPSDEHQTNITTFGLLLLAQALQQAQQLSQKPDRELSCLLDRFNSQINIIFENSISELAKLAPTDYNNNEIIIKCLSPLIDFDNTLQSLIEIIDDMLPLHEDYQVLLKNLRNSLAHIHNAVTHKFDCFINEKLKSIPQGNITFDVYYLMAARFLYLANTCHYELTPFAKYPHLSNKALLLLKSLLEVYKTSLFNTSSANSNVEPERKTRQEKCLVM